MKKCHREDRSASQTGLLQQHRVTCSLDSVQAELKLLLSQVVIK